LLGSCYGFERRKKRQDKVNSRTLWLQPSGATLFSFKGTEEMKKKQSLVKGSRDFQQLSDLATTGAYRLWSVKQN
jgi:hypothetical protein